MTLVDFWPYVQILLLKLTSFFLSLSLGLPNNLKLPLANISLSLH